MAEQAALVDALYWLLYGSITGAYNGRSRPTEPKPHTTAAAHDPGRDLRALVAESA